jgi:hypothetical protein
MSHMNNYEIKSCYMNQNYIYNIIIIRNTKSFDEYAEFSPN